MTSQKQQNESYYTRAYESNGKLFLTHKDRKPKTRTPNQSIEIPCKQVDNAQMVRQVCVSMQVIRHKGIKQDTLAPYQRSNVRMDAHFEHKDTPSVAGVTKSRTEANRYSRRIPAQTGIQAHQSIREQMENISLRIRIENQRLVLQTNRLKSLVNKRITLRR